MADDIVTKKENIWKRLTRLFRSGPVIRHKIAAGEPFVDPKGTASAYKKELNSLYVHSLASYGQYERLSRYADYSEMEYTPEISSAIDIYADEVTAEDERGRILNIKSDDEEIKQTLETFFFEIINIEFNIWSWVRNLPVRRTSRIPLLDGRNITIEELAKEHAAGKENWVYSVQERTGRTVPGKVTWCGLTRSGSTLQRTWLDDDTYVDTTPDHEFILRDGSRRRADTLLPGDSLMPFYRKDTKKSSREGGYEKVYDPATGRYVFTHRRVGEIVTKEPLSSEDRWHVVHHSDFDKKNNSPSNLRRIGDASHASLHNEIGTANGVKGKEILRRPDVIEKAAKGRDRWLRSDEHRQLASEQLLTRQERGEMPSWSAYNSSDLHKQHNEIRSRRMKEFWADPEWKKKTLEKRFNHKVVRIEILPETDDVYCMEVLGPNGEHDRHNFMMLTENGTLDSGVCVSNCKYGDNILFIDANETNGVLNLYPIPINEIEREEGFDKNDPLAVRFRWLTQGNKIIENWQVLHFRLLGNDNFLPYGSSIIEAARRIWRQLILIEDAMLVYRIVRSPERRVFKVEVGNIPPGEVEQYMEQTKNRLRRNQIVDPNTGRVDLRYNPLSVDEDYFIPVRGEKSSDISTLAGGQFTGDIEDVQYIQSKLFAALKVPKAYLGYEAELGSKATLAQQDVRFARTIGRIQKIVVSELNKLAIIHLYLLGYEGEDLANFSIELACPSTIAEQQKLELWRTRFEIAGSAQEGMVDRAFIYKNIFGLGDDAVEEIKEGKRFDKLEDITLEGMTAPPADDAGATGAEELPGEDELPQTLGGETPAAETGGDQAEAEPPPQNASMVVPGPVIQEDGEASDGPGSWDMKCEGCGKGYAWTAAFNPSAVSCCESPKVSYKRKTFKIPRRNMGSTGNDSQISVAKGKDLFSTGEDQHTLVFGTEKQTASDPGDMRALRRLIRRPFSEKVIKKRSFLNESDGVDVKLEEAIDRTGTMAAEITEILKKAQKIRPRWKK